MEPYALCLPLGEGIRAIVPTAFRCLFSRMPGRSLPGAILSRESTTVRPRRPWHEPGCCLPPCSGRNNLRCVPEIRNTGKCWAGKTEIPCGLLPVRESAGQVERAFGRFLSPPACQQFLPFVQDDRDSGCTWVEIVNEAAVFALFRFFVMLHEAR